ncbi:MAG: hypothetical protein GY847_30660 [Proteobacteria bacterium]|nr:hypothetical protein [Pseudomonadota bacterium]
MTEPACKTCMYWMQSPEEQQAGMTGWCRRFPPRPIWIDSPNMPGSNMKPDVHSFMPAVHADLWCGEYKFKGSGKSKPKGKGKNA